MVLCGISKYFYLLSPSLRQIVYALLTRPPLASSNSIRKLHRFPPVRLACVKHAASVHPEPGSNSQFLGILSYFYVNISLISLTHSSTDFLRKLLVNLCIGLFYLKTYATKLTRDFHSNTNILQYLFCLVHLFSFYGSVYCLTSV